jgi:hypothetical protein
MASGSNLQRDQATPEQLRARLQTDVMRLPFVASASLAGVNGRVFATTRNADPGIEVVQIPATALKSTLYIGAPLLVHSMERKPCGQQADRRAQRRIYWRRGGARRLRPSHDVLWRTEICRPTRIRRFEMTASTHQLSGATKDQ